MLRKRWGTSLLEYIILIALFVSILGVILYALFTTVGGKLSDLDSSMQ
jgi:hypothetical protein